MGDRARVAILGGTFDPVHLGHLSIAEQARSLVAAEEAWLLPAGQPPHRPPPRAGPDDRLALVEAAAGDRDRLRVCDLEARRPGPSYTIDTLEALETAYPAIEFWWTLGADAAAGFPRWHRASALAARGRFLIVNRIGFQQVDLASAAGLGFPPGRTRIGSVESPPVSASAVREVVEAGESLTGLVPEAVARLIRARCLYR